MEVGFSNESKMFQLLNQPKPSQMFNDQYAFFSGTSLHMKEHFKLFAGSVKKNFCLQSNNV